MSDDTKQTPLENDTIEIVYNEIVTTIIKEIIDNAVSEIAVSNIETANTPLPIIETIEYTSSNSFVDSIQKSNKSLLQSDQESVTKDTCSIFTPASEVADNIVSSDTTKVVISDVVIIIEDTEPKKSSCTLLFEKIINAIKRTFKD